MNVGLTWAWSIVALTVIVPPLLLPLTVRQIHSMQSLQRHAPEMKAIQQRYKGDEERQQRGAGEVLQGEQDQPGGLVLADPRPDPDLLRALLRPAGLRRRDPAEVPGVEPGVAQHRHESRPTSKDAWGPLLIVIYVIGQIRRSLQMRRRFSRSRGSSSSCRSPSSPSSSTSPPAPDALLADHEPVDDRPGARDATDDSQAGATAQTLVSHSGAGAAAARRPRGRRPRGEATSSAPPG